MTRHAKGGLYLRRNTTTKIYFKSWDQSCHAYIAVVYSAVTFYYMRQGAFLDMFFEPLLIKSPNTAS